jgi:diguanylate cyclase (GGDEF)-like protein
VTILLSAGTSGAFAAFAGEADHLNPREFRIVHFHQLSQHDPLTGLPNGVSLLNRIEHAAQRAQRSHTKAAILFVDIDRFKQVNGTHGHHVGDQLLLAIAGRLSPLVRPGDTLAVN